MPNDLLFYCTLSQQSIEIHTLQPADFKSDALTNTFLSHPIKYVYRYSY